MADGDFSTLALAVLAQVESAIETADVGGALDVELREGVLNITVEATGKQFVLNKHGPMRQLWLSSPMSGAGHFSYDAALQQWRDSKGRELFAVLIADVKQLSGVQFG